MAFYFKKQKLEVYSMQVRYSYMKRLNLSMIGSLNSQKETFQCFSSEWFLHAILGVCPRIEMVITDHQVKNCAKALVFANSLMLFFPLDVLAETCESDSSYFNMPLLFIIALIGATVGGLLARQRRGELKRLNEQLRQINAALRRQAKIESYAPKLSYAPVGRTPEAELLVDPKKEQLIGKLRTGKKFLRNQELEKAFVEFKAALDLAVALGDHLEAKKAARGLGASLQRQRQVQRKP
ncbi:hypothetical protein HPP92_027544 [Vanilla planifolia]|uniref:Uncharacterized protein n=1 Tax=Vanilla planifolia TaxID=51239 RepID=A0A835PBG5_VANPL|nr:hypothetical protein HPP92_027544 [Vanilla planifolia]